MLARYSVLQVMALSLRRRPAIWLLPRHETFGGWPASGEIDVMEATGNAAGFAGNRGVDTVGSTIHWGTNLSRPGPFLVRQDTARDTRTPHLGLNVEQNRFHQTSASMTLPGATRSQTLGAPSV